MRSRFLTSLGVVVAMIAIGVLVPVPATAQGAGDTWTLPRTADGQPDLQGRVGEQQHHAVGAP